MKLLHCLQYCWPWHQREESSSFCKSEFNQLSPLCGYATSLSFYTECPYVEEILVCFTMCSSLLDLGPINIFEISDKGLKRGRKGRLLRRSNNKYPGNCIFFSTTSWLSVEVSGLWSHGGLSAPGTSAAQSYLWSLHCLASLETPLSDTFPTLLCVCKPENEVKSEQAGCSLIDIKILVLEEERTGEQFTPNIDHKSTVVRHVLYINLPYSVSQLRELRPRKVK